MRQFNAGAPGPLTRCAAFSRARFQSTAATRRDSPDDRPIDGQGDTRGSSILIRASFLLVALALAGSSASRDAHDAASIDRGSR